MGCYPTKDRCRGGRFPEAFEKCAGNPRGTTSAGLKQGFRRDDSQLLCRATGGCRDGLYVDWLSQNQGTESTLAFLLSLAEKHVLQNTLTSSKIASPNCNQGFSQWRQGTA